VHPEIIFRFAERNVVPMGLGDSVAKLGVEKQFLDII
jgi:hypothetical protein